MASSHVLNLRKIFLHAVQSVQPINLILNSKCVQRVNGEKLQVVSQTISLTGKKCHLVGFGKAVLGMAVQIERILDERLVSGVISIPVCTMDKFSGVTDMKLKKNSVIRVFEGAENNLPDKMALNAAKAIKNLTESMNQDDILFVLVSGGGSALLPLPVESISLDEKADLIRNLARCGADIEELNIVRIAMSATKGGKLAKAGRNACRVFSLVISDIVNDPLHLIASGPTVEFERDDRTARSVLEKYGIWSSLEDKLKAIFEKTSEPAESLPNSHVFLIGNNKVAVEAALEQAKVMGYKSCILSTSIVGQLEELVEKYTKFLNELQQFFNGDITLDFLAETYPFDKTTFSNFSKTLTDCRPGENLCLILAGEPTAHVRGNGKGGRNQELALRLSKVFYENVNLNGITFLSAGTDGIDGPTNAAGAIGSAEVIRSFLKMSKMNDLQTFIDRNDSFSFYKRIEEEANDFHICTGHTGTNVMDIHLIVMPVPKK